MRNLLEFPVTLDEVIEGLERLKADIMQEGACGDIRPLLLHRAIQIVKREKFFHGDPNE
jgi:hypothetical protein